MRVVGSVMDVGVGGCRNAELPKKNQPSFVLTFPIHQ